jgi:hypothetical protein
LTGKRKTPYTNGMNRAEPMLKYAEKQTKRPPVNARPQPHIDRQKLRAEINKRFSKSLEYLAR